jgi:hypothetical protein
MPVDSFSEAPMNKYCKSYPLGELRRFPGWSDGALTEEREMSDETPVFLTDILTVLISPVGRDKDKLLYSQDSPEWREFCTGTLKFRIPEDLAFAYAESEQS